MSQVDYTGPHGGMLAMAFAAGVAFATTALLAVGGFIWRVFGEPRIKQLQDDREADNDRCQEELAVQRTRIVYLEAMLWAHGPQQLRADMQASISEIHVAMIRERQATDAPLTEGSEP